LQPLTVKGEMVNEPLDIEKLIHPSSKNFLLKSFGDSEKSV
jgi:hypothetical protein